MLAFPTRSGRPPAALAIASAIVLLAALGTLPVLAVPLRVLAHAPAAAWDFLQHFLAKPDWSYLPRLGQRLLETLEMAFLGTVIAMVLSLPLGLLAARNTTPWPWLGAALRELMTFMRAMPDLVWAMLFVSAVGLGPLAGVMSIALVSVGFMGRFFAEAIEVIDPKPVEAVAANGAGWLQVRTFAVIPQAAPDLLGIVFYLFDHNVRQSAVIGMVGAGGIGYELIMSMHLFEYDHLIMLMVAIYLVVSTIDRISAFLRERVI
jgi:phosphonate transport system permease protein